MRIVSVMWTRLNKGLEGSPDVLAFYHGQNWHYQSTLRRLTNVWNYKMYKNRIFQKALGLVSNTTNKVAKNNYATVETATFETKVSKIHHFNQGEFEQLFVLAFSPAQIGLGAFDYSHVKPRWCTHVFHANANGAQNGDCCRQLVQRQNHQRFLSFVFRPGKLRNILLNGKF